MTQREHDKLEADLSAYLDGELDAERVREVERHLAESEDARRLLDELRGVSDQLAALPWMRSPSELAAALARQAERRLRPGDSTPTRRGRVLIVLARVGASAAVIAACFFVGWQVLKPAETVPGVPASAEERGARATDATRQAIVEPADDPVLARAELRDQIAKTAEVIEDTSTLDDAPELWAGVAMKSKEMPATTGAIELDVAAVTERLPEAGEVVSLGVPRTEFDAADTPAVNIEVHPQNEVQYHATAALLDDWAARGLGLEAGETLYFAADGRARGQDSAARARRGSATMAAQGPVERAYQVQANELQYRISQLELSAPQQVHVQMVFKGSDSDILAQAASAAPPSEIPPPALRIDPARGLPVSRSEETDVNYGRAVQPQTRRAAPDRGASADMEQVAGSSRETKTPIRRGEEVDRVELARVPADAKAAPAGRGRMGGAGRTGLRGERGAERRREASADPDERILDQVARELRQHDESQREAASRPGAAEGEESAGLGEKKDTARRADRRFGQATRPSEDELALRLLKLILERTRATTAGEDLAGDEAAPRSTGDVVRFRVRLLPPPVATSAPVGQPTSRPAE